MSTYFDTVKDAVGRAPRDELAKLVDIMRGRIAMFDREALKVLQKGTTVCI